MRRPLIVLALALLGALVGLPLAVWAALSTRERAVSRAAGDADPTPDEIGAAEARDWLRSIDPDGAW